jgi:hypothetical protein
MQRAKNDKISEYSMDGYIIERKKSLRGERNEIGFIINHNLI